MSLNIGCSFLSSHSGSPVVGLLDIDLMSLWYFCVCFFFFNISPFCYFDQKISRNISLNSPILSSAISTLLLNLSANFFFISVVALFKYRIFKIPFHIFYFCVNNSFLFMNTIFSLFFIVCFTLPLWKHLYELLSCLCLLNPVPGYTQSQSLLTRFYQSVFLQNGHTSCSLCVW